MAAREQYLVRRVTTGHMYTIIAFSPRGAMEVFTAKYHPPKGEEYEVKTRGHGEWTTFRVR